MKSRILHFIWLRAIWYANFANCFLPQPGKPARSESELRAGLTKSSILERLPFFTPTTDNSTKIVDDVEEISVEDHFSPEVIQESVSLMDDALIAFNSSSASELLQRISDMRSNNTEPCKMDEYLNEILARCPDRQMRIWEHWARLRPLSRVSKRARGFSMRKTLDFTTPPQEDEAEDTIEDQMRRRRRALVSLLRQLSEALPKSERVRGPAIRYLEKKAVREQKQHLQNEDLTARRPEGLETPQYDVLVRRVSQGYEIRRYEPFSIATVSMTKTRPVDSYLTDATVSNPNLSGARAFGALAGYLFGKNEKKIAMKMTAPVLMRQASEENEEKLMSFVLPSDYWNENGLKKAPQPLKESGVKLERDEGGYRAVSMFGGYTSKADTERRKTELLQALSDDKEWSPIVGIPVALAQYNDPFTPPWKRLNEVSVAVQPRKP